MFLLKNTGYLLKESLNQPVRNEREEIARCIKCTPRQVAEYYKNKRFPPIVKLKLKHQLKEQGIDISTDIPKGSACAYGWLHLSQKLLTEEFKFLPKTMKLIQQLAMQDIAFLRTQEAFKPIYRLDLYKAYLLEQVIPFYDINPENLKEKISRATNLGELEPIKFDLFVESFLFLLAHAEAEFLLQDKTDLSILGMHIPKTGQQIDAPIKLFFIIWLKTIGLDRKSFLSGKYQYDAEETDEDDFDLFLDEEGMSSDALAKQFQRYFNEGIKPKWATIDKWAKELYPIASKKADLKMSEDGYAAQIKFIFGGVLVLDRLFEEGMNVYPEERLLQIMSTYHGRFEKHFSAMDMEVGETPTPIS
jgi:hypothetical protein